MAKTKNATELVVGDRVWIDDGGGAWGVVTSVVLHKGNAATRHDRHPWRFDDVQCSYVTLESTGCIPPGFLDDGQWMIQGNARRIVAIHD